MRNVFVFLRNLSNEKGNKFNLQNNCLLIYIIKSTPNE
jgi:hypothetical protein